MMDIQIDKELIKIIRLRWILMFVWAVLVVAVVGTLMAGYAAYHENLNLLHARAYFEKDVAYRRWNAQRGGLYAPLNELTTPNPYLKIPDRDVVTDSGRKLTLINPAYMTRQVHELIALDKGVLGHITSLNPIRPENAADRWEAEALKAFEQGVEEVSGISKIDDRPYLRLMRPLVTEQSCMKCHEKQGYRVGDIRGGISVSIPYANIAASKHRLDIGTIMMGVVFWLIGTAGIQFGTSNLLKGAQQRNQIVDQLRNNEVKSSKQRDLAQQYFNVAGVLMVVLGREGQIIEINKKACDVLNVEREDAYHLNWFEEFIPEEQQDEVLQVFRKVISGDMEIAEYYENTIITRTGQQRQIAWHNAILRDDEGEIVASLSSGEDITEVKKLEEGLLESEFRYRELYETAPISYFTVRAVDGRIVRCNLTAEKLLGYSQKEILQLNVLDLYEDTPDGKAPEREYFKKIQHGEFFSGKDLQMRCKDGSLRWVSLSVKPVKDETGRIIESHSMVVDIEERKQAEKEQKRLSKSLKHALLGTIQAVAQTVEKRDPYTAGHQRSVAEIAAIIAHEMGLSEERIEGIRLGAIIHDIGKIYVPAEILNSPVKLRKTEFDVIKTHPEVGYEILEGVEFPWPVLDMVYQHHERLDGTGYPRGLKGNEIMMEARILAVADVIEAMASDRPYRPALGIEVGLAEIEQHKGTKYDSDVVDACLKVVRENKLNIL
ncbi:MAG: HD domain-containing phosphohydrolase [Sedimenticola sp.]